MTGNISAKADKAAAKKPKKVSKYSKRKVDPAFYWMTIPAMILVCIFLYLPFLQGAMYSFTNSQGYGDYKFIGFKNYIAMFQDARVGHAYLFTIFIAILITLGTNILGMFLAVLLNSKIAFKNGFRAIFFIPYTLSVLVIGYVFKYIFMTPLPALGQALHIDWLSTSMISNPDLAWFPIVFLSIWQGVAYSTLLYLAGLQTIDNEIYEAAAIDGASRWKRVWHITIPGLVPTIVLLTTLAMGNVLNAGFDQVFNMYNQLVIETGDIIDTYVYRVGITNMQFSLATAAGLFKSVVSFVLVVTSYVCAYKFADYKIF